MLSEGTCVRFNHFKPFLLCVRLNRNVDIVTVTNHNVSSLSPTIKVCGHTDVEVLLQCEFAFLESQIHKKNKKVFIKIIYIYIYTYCIYAHT